MITLVQHKKKSLAAIVKEAIITLLFLRPAFYAYRVSTNYVDEEAAVDPLAEMTFNKAYELATESIPGYVLQIYVWLKDPEEAGAYALLSIAISAMTTGYNIAIMSFDFDVDVTRRNAQPIVYV